jgi:hypothetical protein
MYMWRATYRWKALDQGYNFALDLIAIGNFHPKLWAPKVEGIPVVGKCHSDVALMKRHKEYYKEEGGGFPQVRAMVSVVSSSLPVARLGTTNAQIMH